jgi:hypothetical protein
VARQGSRAIRPYHLEGHQQFLAGLLDERRRLDRRGIPRRTYKEAPVRFTCDYLRTSPTNVGRHLQQQTDWPDDG